jgi:transcriptional regulator with XRE-family HTH domain
MPREPDQFPAVLRSLRERANITVAELAEAAGLTRQAVHNYESGARCPTWDAVQKLAEALSVSTDALRDR